MLQDLDTLAARVRQLVLAARDFQSQRTSLQTQITRLEQERSTLRQQLDERDSLFSDATDQLAQHEASLQSCKEEYEAMLAQAQSEAQAASELLRRELQQCQSERDEALRQAQAARAQAEKLCTAADQAQTLVDTVLMRLPGAPQE